MNHRGVMFGCAIAATGVILGMLPESPAPDHISLDLNQWECRQAITVQVLEGDKLTPKGQCIRYDMLIQGEEQ